MGTRHLICVMKNKEYKVAQYGQWDGYPEGQGVGILNFLNNNDHEKFSKQIDKCKFITDNSFYNKAYEELNIHPNGEFISADESQRFISKYPQLDRAMGSDILEYIMNNNEFILENSIKFAGNSIFCEYAYVIDLDKNTFEIYKGFNRLPLGENERFYNFPHEEEYYPVKHVISFDLNSLPTREEFLSNFCEE